MTREQLLNYFLDKPGTFDDDENHVTSLNLASERVCEIEDSSQFIIDLKCDLEFSSQIQKKYKMIQPGKKEGSFQWNRIVINSEISDNDLYELIDTSYGEVLTRLPKEEQDEILDLEL